MIKMKHSKKQKSSCSWCFVIHNLDNGFCKTCGKDWNRK